jgi:amidohydrolase
MEMIDLIKKLASQLQEELVNKRRYLHANPELSFEEYQTSAYLKEELKKIGIQHFEPKANTGFTAIIEGKNPGKKIVALRADMDALPIKELNEISYKSKNNGVMHACGHDVHSTCLLGAASILFHLKDQFEGSVKLIFQPGEEKLPGGASLMIADGALENPKPNSIFGQHVMPFLPVGTVGFRKGLYMASSDELFFKVKGKGGHGAMPHLSLDPVPVAAQLISALQTITSRFANPLIPTVLTIGKVIANGATNVIPDEVYMEGTFRTLDENWRKKAHEHIERICLEIGKANSIEIEIEIRKGYPFLKNDEAITQMAKEAAIAYLGEDKVVDLDIWMASEDFAYYSQVMPASFYRLGTRNESKGIVSGVHTPTFNIDESALEIGSGLMAWLAIKELQN